MAIRSGYKFQPTDEEIMDYLLNKVTGSRSLVWSCGDYISTADLYGSKEPWEVFGDCEQKERYFFTEQKGVGQKKSNQRICRNVGKGFWSNKGQKTTIYGGGRRGIIGYKRCFRYVRKKGQNSMNSSSDWLLREFTLPDELKRGVKETYRNYAICVLKRKKGSRDRRRDDRGEEPVDVDEWLLELLGLQQPPDDALCVPKGTTIDDDDDRAVVLAVPIADSSEADDDWLLQLMEEDDRSALCVPEGTSIDDGRAVEYSVGSTCGDLAVPIADSSEADDDWLLQQMEEDDHSALLCVTSIDDDRACGDSAVPIADSSEADDDWILQLIGDVAEDDSVQLDKSSECSILAPAAAAAPSSLESKKGDTFTEAVFAAPSNDHFAWDDFGDYQFPWAGIQMLPVSVV